MALLTNAGSPLTIPTHDGSGQLTHPDVVDFKIEHGMDTWAGYRYWMAMTPYPNMNDAHEDPNVVASNDGQTWVVPTGLTNPLQDLAGSPGLFNADTDIIYDPDENCLRVYWNNGMRKIYSDMSMSAIVDHSQALDTFFGGKAMSWSIWRESATKWHAWMVAAPDGTRKIYYLFSDNGNSWSGTPTACTHELTNHVAGATPWHLDAKFNKWENRVEFMINPYSSTYGPIIYGECAYGSFTTITCPLADVWIATSAGNWDANLYRSTFVIERKAAEYFYYCWYSGWKDNGNGTTTWEVGYTSGALGTSITPLVSTPTITQSDKTYTIATQIQNTTAAATKTTYYSTDNVNWATMPAPTLISGDYTDGIWQSQGTIGAVPGSTLWFKTTVEQDGVVYESEIAEYYVLPQADSTLVSVIKSLLPQPANPQQSREVSVKLFNESGEEVLAIPKWSILSGQAQLTANPDGTATVVPNLLENVTVRCSLVDDLDTYVDIVVKVIPDSPLITVNGRQIDFIVDPIGLKPGDSVILEYRSKRGGGWHNIPLEPAQSGWIATKDFIGIDGKLYFRTKVVRGVAS